MFGFIPVPASLPEVVFLPGAQVRYIHTADILLSQVAVSYTHLDVYKRQAHHQAALGVSVHTGLGVGHLGIIDQGCQHVEYHKHHGGSKSGEQQGHDSQNNQDVYKRQLAFSSACSLLELRQKAIS